jgi:hypothetical protein
VVCDAGLPIAVFAYAADVRRSQQPAVVVIERRSAAAPQRRSAAAPQRRSAAAPCASSTLTSDGMPGSVREVLAEIPRSAPGQPG